ncbi:hypothetical protein [Reinekea thalattae]|uniref:Tetratricopeptide repeat protein n=1 Tax=Reinekea thalattae TaxID=2593301 RepID=A0A5C8ZBW5_9GAMM|nr:hypothetical protein [Reinekea thalattae]TXR54653.1 hypothetical protein FME95_08985 [Reinekea thalattae]
MNKLIIIAIVFYSSFSYADCPTDQFDMACIYGDLSEAVRVHIANKDFNSAERVAEDMLNIDPADSWARVYLLVALKSQSKPIPDWLSSGPWPNSNEEERILESIGNAIIND